MHFPETVPVARARWIAGAALVVGLVLTALAVQATNEARRTEARAHFEGHVNRLEVEVQRRITRAAYGLKGARGAYAVAGKPLLRAQFTDYVQTRNLPQEFPGIRGFGFIQRVERTQLAEFEAAERADQAPDFAVRTTGSQPDLLVIKFIEPLGMNLAARGLDVGADPVRREGAQRAIDTGQDALTGRITLVQDEQQGAGWLLFVPVYRPGTDAQSVRGRREQLIGLVYAPIIAAEILRGTKEIVDSKLDFRLFDGAASEGRLLFDSEIRVDPRRSVTDAPVYAQRVFQESRQLTIGGRTLVLQIASAPGLEAGMGAVVPLAVAAMGLLLSVLLAVSAWLLMHARERALWLARRMTGDLERMSKVVERTSNAVFGTGTDRRITWINDGFTRMTGYSQTEAVGKTASELLEHPLADPHAHAVLREAVATGTSARLELLNRRKDGSDYWVEIEVQPTRNSSGHVTGYIELALDITQRKLAERQLAANEAFLEQAERIAGVGGWEVDLIGGYLRVTPQMRRIFGLAQDASPSMDDFLGFFGAEQRALIERTTRESVLSGRPWDLEMPVRQSESGQLWVRTVGDVVREGGRSVRLMGILQDVTQRRNLEEELRLNNARLQTVMENLPCGMSVFNGDLQLVAHNTKFRTLLGFPDDLFAGRQVSFEDVIRFNASRGEYGSGDVENQVLEIIERARDPQAHRFERRRPNGTQLEVRGAPMPGGGFVTTYVDVTDRKRAEEALQASEDLMRVVTDNIPGRVAYWDRDMRCKFVNRGYCEAYGRGRDELLGRTADEIFGSERYAQLEPLISAALRGEPQSLERAEKSLAGDDVTMLIHYIPDTQGDEVRGFFVLALDITEIKEARDVALQASLAKSQFLANMSHEIRTPMNAILGMLTLLKATPLDTRQLDYATKTEGAARSLLGLLNDILDFSKVEAGKMTLDPHPFSLDQLLRDLSVILSANVGAKNVEVLFDVDPAIPAQLLGDDMRLRQVLINLGGNAIKFTDGGEVVVLARLADRKDGEVTLDFSVRDTGIGIAPEHQARIFTGFSQAESSTSRRYGGTGLGLAICQRLVNLMGGELRLDSVPGQGSRFHFQLTFPVLTGTAAAPAAARLISRVLIVDDNPVARQVLAEMAQSLGWVADLAASGEEALALLGPDKAAQLRYDAMFIDWRMPGMDGWETSQRIRGLAGVGSAPVLVMVTAHGRAMLAQRSAHDRALLDGFLVKPVTASMLAEAVAEALGQAPAAPPAGAVMAPAQPLAGLRVLVVEDNANNQQVARELLAAQGASVDIAVNGLDGVRQVLAAQPPHDVVLMDVQMPVMDGYAATRVLRQDHGLTRLPIVAMTANAMASDREECLAAGMTDHVGKPFDLGDLVATLLRHTGGTPATTAPAGAAPAHARDGVDVQAAIARLGGNEALYRKLFPSFCTDIINLCDQLAARVQTGAHDESPALLHTLKGLAATMGATDLAGLAREAESLLGRGTPEADQALATRLQAGVHQAIGTINGQLHPATHPATHVATPSAPAAPVHDSAPGELAAQLRALVARLQASDMDALLLHESLRPRLSHLPKAELAPLDAAMDTLDFSGAIQACSNLLTRHFS